MATTAEPSISRELNPQPWVSHRVFYGHLLAADGEERIDEVLVVVALSSNSYDY